MALDAKLDALDHRAAALHEQHEDEIQTLHLDAAPAGPQDLAPAAAAYSPPWEDAELSPAPAAADAADDSHAAPAASANAALDDAISPQPPDTEPAAPLSAADFAPPAALPELDLDFDLDLPPAEGETAPQATAPAPASTLAASEPALIVPAADEEEPIELDISGMSDDELEAALQAELAAIDAAEAELQRETAAVEADLAAARARAAAAPAPAPALDDAAAEPTMAAEPAPAIEPASAADVETAEAWPDAAAEPEAEPLLTAADMLPPGPADLPHERREPTLGAVEEDDFDVDEEALVQLSAAGVARSGRDAGPAAGTHARPSRDAAPQSLAAAHSLHDDDFARADADADAAAESRARTDDEADAAALEEPGFVKRDRRRQRLGKIATVVMSAGSVLLLAGLAGQVVATFRNPLAAAVPSLKPALNAACVPLGCKVELPAQIESVTIEQGELQSLSENTFSFTTLLRNQSATAQTWPHIELVLDDDKDKAILRRVFAPADYLAPGAAQAETLAQGFGPHSEQSVKLYFELKQLKASGYHIAVFYP